MKTKNRLTIILTTVVTLLPMILSFIMYEKLPDQIPIHFNTAGEPDNYLSKNIASFGLPLALALLNIFVHFKINTDPKRQNSSEIIKIIGKWTAPVISSVSIPISLFWSIGYEAPIQIIIPCMVGILLMITGNYLPKSKQNYTIGIKLPWTLNDIDNWNKTHRLAGYLYMICGLLIVVFGLVQFAMVYIVISSVAMCIAIPFIYSYALYRIRN